MTTVDLAMQLLLENAQREIAGKVLGLVGFGPLGRQIASRAVHYGMEVVYADSEPGAGPCRRVLLGELLATSDFVMPLEAGAVNTLRDELFSVLMKPGAKLVSLADIAEEPRQPQH
jgi:phosphoglycerate dehydrogenase-like enzyme